jgi:hypothetical protein
MKRHVSVGLDEKHAEIYLDECDASGDCGVDDVKGGCGFWVRCGRVRASLIVLIYLLERIGWEIFVAVFRAALLGRAPWLESGARNRTDDAVAEILSRARIMPTANYERSRDPD